MHNWPGLPVGEFAMRPGRCWPAPTISRSSSQGRGTHAACRISGIDPVVVAAQIVLALQTIVSRQTSPLDGAVVSVTQIHGGVDR